jgi:uncharacterized delta-60 repeat protein
MSVKFVRVLAVCLIVTAAYMPPASAAATTGFLDKTFNGDGRVLTNVAGDDSGEAVAVQADGKIVVVGSSSGGTDVALVRYNTDGSLDTSFGGGDGIVITDVNGDDTGNAIAIQGDQKIVVAGSTDGTSQALLMRYDTNGILDTSFGGGDGITTTTIGAGAIFLDLTIQGDGSIVAAGAMTPDGVKGLAVVARYDSSGTLDTAGFASPDGYVTTNLGAGGGQMTGVALDGTKIVTAGTSFSSTSSTVAVLRYTSAGVLDSTFGGGDGKVTTDVATGYDFGGDVAIDGDGNIDVAGGGGNKDVFLRYDDTGVLDTSFGGGDGIAFAGKAGFEGFSGIAIRGTGEIVAVDAGFGKSYQLTGEFKAVQVTSTGALDTTFGSNGTAIASFSMNLNCGEPPIANDVAIDGNGAVVVAGTAGVHNDFAVARFGDAANAVIGQADLLIGTGSTLIGGDVYNSTGHNQTISRHVARGKTLSFSVKVQNDGNAPDVITLYGRPVFGLAITYLLGGNDVTRAVLGFKGKALSLDPGESKTLKVRAKVGAKAKVGKVLKVRTEGDSFNATSGEDLVVAAITVKR